MNPTFPPAGPAPAPFVPNLRPVPAGDLGGRTGPPDWLWDGYVAAGAVTLLTSQWKSGKTTLRSVLLAKMAAGGTLAGRAVRPGRAVALSEEAGTHWRLRDDRLRFGPNVGFLCRPFLGRPTLEQWQRVIDQFVRMRAAERLDLAVIDPLASFLPVRSENNANAMLDALLPLQRLTSAGAGVLVLHHPSKGDPAAGQAARGSGALAGYVDVLVEMNWVGRPTDDDRRRRLTAFSRFATTPAQLVVELTADGTDYTEAADDDPAGAAIGPPVLIRLLEAAPEGLTRRQILERWPDGCPAPNEVTLWRWLGRAARYGSVIRSGTGHAFDPYRYRLPMGDEKGGVS